jgi:hypothetical protein
MERRGERDFTTESTEGTEKSRRKTRREQPKMAVPLKEHDFAGVGVYGWERAARAGVAVF